MSATDFIIVPGDVLRDPIIAHAAKLLYGRLKLYAGKDGKAYPKHATLASEICLADRQVRYLLMELRAAGWIDWVRTRTSCVYTVHPDRQKSADQARQDVADLSAEKCRSRSAEKCRQNRSIENHHQKRRSEKKKSPCLKNPAPPEEEKSKPFFSQKVDDEKPKPRTPLENPEMEFRARITERHGAVVDQDQLLQDVLGELDCIPLSEFLAADLTATTAPGRLTNPHGHYRRLARKVMRQRQAAGLESIMGAPLRVPQEKFKPSCTCNDGLLPDGTYCACRVGDVRRQVDELKKAAVPGVVSLPDPVSEQAAL